ncbi:MAG TPA: family 20 glycosylhydrolase [Hanamia sp.]|nr:family 20 glycosylhydrolase [Hanamia sp.]
MSACIFSFAGYEVQSAPFTLNSSDTLPVRGFSVAAPMPSEVNAFVKFIKEELAPRNINTLILRVDFNYQYESHPELREDTALSKSDVKKIVAICKQSGIHIVPQINLLGHQSWASKTGKLLAVYPQFDETPWVKMPEKYVWPNEDGLYCKSYCPLHPEVHKVVFDLVDEVCDVFETDAFHAGMDEVFYIADSKCPRCSGHDPAELFAGEVTKIRNHLAEKERHLWIWGDRLIDGKTTGMGRWEASMNNTFRAVDMIPKDVVICDWHYERPDQTAVYFAMKGLSVVTCPFQDTKSALLQLDDMYKFRQNSTPEMKGRFLGIVSTAWSGAGAFLKEFYEKNPDKSANKNSVTNTLKAVFPKL